MYRLFLVLITIGVLVGTGLLSGYWNDRWITYDESAISVAGVKLESIPLNVGTWIGSDVAQDPKAIPEELIGRSIVRRYVRQSDGTVVTIFLGCGPTRPMWYGHQPTECYPGAGYRLSGAPLQEEFESKAKSPEVDSKAKSPTEQFQVATFSMDEAAAPLHLRVFWSWSGDGKWQTPENPAKAFSHYPYLYKLYIIRRLTKEDEPVNGDPCIQFARAFLPELKKALF
jgi:hypothetical protein